MKNFILESDFQAIATTVDLGVLSDSNSAIIQSCNQIAVDEAAGYLNTRFDIQNLFKDPVEYSDSTAYAVGDRIYTIVGTPGVYLHYTCIEVAIPGTEITNTDYFEAKDSRDQKLLQVVMAMSLFYIHQRLTPSNIPTFRSLAYDGNGQTEIMSSIKWLMLIQKGSLNPYNWEENTTGSDIDGDPDTIGDNTAAGILWGNDLGEDYSWYNVQQDPNQL